MMIAGLSLLLTLPLTTALNPVPVESPYIANYRNDLKAAYSFTFDDGFRAEVEDALSVIEPLQLKGTFFVMPLAIRDDKVEKFISWERLREMAASGQEIGTHASIKPKLHEIPEEEAAAIINGGWELIRENVGIEPVSFAYPGGSKRNDALQSIVDRNHYFTRGKAIGYGNTDFRTWTTEKAQEQVREAIEAGEWQIVYVHSIVDGYSPFQSVAEFRGFCEWLAGQQDQLWIAPMGTVGRYERERDSAKLESRVTGEHSLELELNCPLEPADVFNLPLTVVVPAKGVVRATARMGDVTLPVIIRSDSLLVDVPVNSGPVELRWNPAP